MELGRRHGTGWSKALIEGYPGVEDTFVIQTKEGNEAKCGFI